jgi:hypothetical protein
MAPGAIIRPIADQFARLAQKADQNPTSRE